MEDMIPYHKCKWSMSVRRDGLLHKIIQEELRKLESMILATKSGTPIIGQIAVVMGWIMNAIYKVLDAVGIQNIGLCIIIFSILIYLCMTPLQIKQQKFSKLSAIMQPEIQKNPEKIPG